MRKGSRVDKYLSEIQLAELKSHESLAPLAPDERLFIAPSWNNQKCGTNFQPP